MSHRYPGPDDYGQEYGQDNPLGNPYEGFYGPPQGDQYGHANDGSADGVPSGASAPGAVDDPYVESYKSAFSYESMGFPTPPSGAGYGSQGYSQPGYGQTGYSQPNYGQTRYGQPNYGQPQYNNPPAHHPGAAPSSWPGYLSPAPSYPSAITPGPSPRSKITAAVLAFFIGSFGVHNFYLGYTDRAKKQLLLGASGYLLSIVLIGLPLVFAAWVWSMIDFLMILLSGGDYDRDGYGRPMG